jgi:hypothetical protein
VYFHSSTYAAAFYEQPLLNPNPNRAIPYLSEVPADPPATGFKFANPASFQIISAGLDERFGIRLGTVDPTVYPQFKSGLNYNTDQNGANFNVGGGEYDNITNFSEGRTLEDHIDK